jgi:hypothetical protein
MEMDNEGKKEGKERWCGSREEERIYRKEDKY